MFGSRTAIGGGLVCGLAAALWLHAHSAETQAASARDPSPAAAVKKGGSHGWRWLPWSQPETVAPPTNVEHATTAADIGAWKGTPIALAVHVVDEEGRAMSGVPVTVRVQRYEYAEAIEAQRAPAADGNGDGEYEGTTGELGDEGEYEGTSDVDAWIAYETVRTGRDGRVTAHVVPDVTAMIVAAGSGDERATTQPLYFSRGDESNGDAGAVYESRSGRTIDSSYQIELEVQRPGAIVGTIVDDRGRAVAGANVSLSPRDDSGEAEADTTEAAEPIVTDGDGHFRAAVARGGAFDLEISADHFQPLTEPAVQVLPGRETNVNLTLLPGVDLRGVILDARGQPIENASVSASAEDGTGSGGGAYVPQGQNGEFTISNLARGRYTVSASAQGFLPETVNGVESGSDRPMTIRLREGAKIEGEVLVSRELLPESVAPAPDSGLDVDAVLIGSVLLQKPDSESVEYGGSTSVSVGADGRGHFEIAGAQPGAWTVVVIFPTATTVGPRVEAREGATSYVSLNVPDGRGAVVAGIVRDEHGNPAGSGSVTLAGAMPGLAAPIGPDGRFRFVSVAPGDYQLTAWVYLPAVENAAAPQESYTRSTSVSQSLHVGRASIDLELVARATPGEISIGDIGHEDGEVPQTVSIPEPATTVSDGGTLTDPEPAEFVPDVTITADDAGLLVLKSPPGPSSSRLFPGDRVTSIDGATVDPSDPYSLLEHLQGAKGSLCRITADRPASGESVSVILARTRPAENDDDQVVTRDRIVLE